MNGDSSMGLHNGNHIDKLIYQLVLNRLQQAVKIQFQQIFLKRQLKAT